MASAKSREEQRLATLRHYQVLDTGSEQSFDDLAFLASQICGTPMSMVSLVDRDRQWFKARIGIDLPEGPREGAFCDHAIRRHEVFVVEDARLDSRFTGQPMVVSAPHVRFYAGAPLIAPSGDIIGTLAVLDHVPRRLSEGQQSALLRLSRQAIHLLESRVTALEAEQQRAELEAILSSLPDAVYVGDSGGIKRANAEAARMLGFSSVAEVKQDIASLATKIRLRRADTREPIAPADQAFAHALEGRADVQEVIIRDVTTGADRVVRTACAPLRRGDEVVGAVAINTDITDAKRSQARQQLLASASEAFATSSNMAAALQQMAVEVVPAVADWCAVDLIGAGGVVERAALQPADSGPAGLLGRASKEWVDRVCAGETPPPQELGVHSLVSVPLIARGEPLGTLTFAMTTTSLQFDATDRAFARELARVVSVGLENARLFRERAELLARESAARESAEAANQAKDEFLAMLGHELRNPLSPILTAVELLKLRPGENTGREQVIIERQAQHLLRLVDDLLDVSRIARGKVELRRAPTEMSAVLATALEIASPLFEDKGHRLELDVAEGLWVDGDQARLSQVVANLLTNAARYTPNGGSIHLSAKRERDQIVIRVRDNGTGIAPEMLPRIFDLFIQEPRQSNRAEGGLGLGLSLVRSLMALHDGTVTAFSAGRNRGSEFVLRLPRLPNGARASTARPAPPPSQPALARKILVVDDNADAVELLAELLRSRGHETAVAYDGPTAIATARAFEPDLAILDIGLPVMDGYELADHLRHVLGERAPQMIALTGYGQEHNRRRSLQAGFASHLVKPVDAELLFRTVAQVSGADRQKSI